MGENNIVKTLCEDFIQSPQETRPQFQLKQDVFVKRNPHDKGQFQRRPISQGQIF